MFPLHLQANHLCNISYVYASHLLNLNVYLFCKIINDSYIWASQTTNLFQYQNIFHNLIFSHTIYNYLEFKYCFTLNSNTNF